MEERRRTTRSAAKQPAAEAVTPKGARKKGTGKVKVAASQESTPQTSPLQDPEGTKHQNISGARGFNVLAFAERAAASEEEETAEPLTGSNLGAEPSGATENPTFEPAEVEEEDFNVEPQEEFPQYENQDKEEETPQDSSNEDSKDEDEDQEKTSEDSPNEDSEDEDEDQSEEDNTATEEGDSSQEDSSSDTETSNSSEDEMSGSKNHTVGTDPARNMIDTDAPGGDTQRGQVQQVKALTQGANASTTPCLPSDPKRSNYAETIYLRIWLGAQHQRAEIYNNNHSGKHHRRTIPAKSIYEHSLPQIATDVGSMSTTHHQMFQGKLVENAFAKYQQPLLEAVLFDVRLYPPTFGDLGQGAPPPFKKLMDKPEGWSVCEVYVLPEEYQRVIRKNAEHREAEKGWAFHNQTPLLAVRETDDHEKISDAWKTGQTFEGLHRVSYDKEHENEHYLWILRLYGGLWMEHFRPQSHPDRMGSLQSIKQAKGQDGASIFAEFLEMSDRNKTSVTVRSEAEERALVNRLMSSLYHGPAMRFKYGRPAVEYGEAVKRRFDSMVSNGDGYTMETIGRAINKEDAVTIEVKQAAQVFQASLEAIQHNPGACKALVEEFGASHKGVDSMLQLFDHSKDPDGNKAMEQHALQGMRAERPQKRANSGTGRGNKQQDLQSFSTNLQQASGSKNANHQVFKTKLGAAPIPSTGGMGAGNRSQRQAAATSKVIYPPFPHGNVAIDTINVCPQCGPLGWYCLGAGKGCIFDFSPGNIVKLKGAVLNFDDRLTKAKEWSASKNSKVALKGRKLEHDYWQKKNSDKSATTFVTYCRKIEAGAFEKVNADVDSPWVYQRMKGGKGGKGKQSLPTSGAKAADSYQAAPPPQMPPWEAHSNERSHVNLSPSNTENANELCQNNESQQCMQELGNLLENLSTLGEVDEQDSIQVSGLVSDMEDLFGKLSRCDDDSLLEHYATLRARVGDVQAVKGFTPKTLQELQKVSLDDKYEIAKVRSPNAIEKDLTLLLRNLRVAMHAAARLTASLSAVGTVHQSLVVPVPVKDPKEETDDAAEGLDTVPH